VHVIEAGGDLGGTWYWNRYPGARCDIESMAYSYSWSDELEQEWTWSERYATQAEILRYLNHVADRFDLRRSIEFGRRVTGATYDEEGDRWSIRSDRGDVLCATFLIMATGCLSAPRMPDIPGIGRFTGPAHHTGLWPHEAVDFGGKRVGVIGTGSSAVQAIPLIAAAAEHVTVFQRTPPFSVPSWNSSLDPDVIRERKAHYTEFRQIARESSGGHAWHERSQSVFDETEEERNRELEARYQIGGFFLTSAYSDLFTDEKANEVLAEFVRGKIRQRVLDPDIAELLCPYTYPIATKRMCVDVEYYEAYNRDNVGLVSLAHSTIDEITANGLRVDGEELAFDILVFATGFDAMTGALLALEIRGRSGRSLQEAWANGARSLLGLAIAGFPNLFMINGPGSPSVLTNMIVSIEQHVDWIADCIRYMRDHGFLSVEATPDAEEAWTQHVRRLGKGSLYPRANSWYLGANIPGKPRVLLPYVGGAGRYRAECDRIAENGYDGFAFGTPRPRGS
jgi:cyclohexanone monooxygenase